MSACGKTGYENTLGVYVKLLGVLLYVSECARRIKKLAWEFDSVTDTVPDDKGIDSSRKVIQGNRLSFSVRAYHKIRTAGKNYHSITRCAPLLVGNIGVKIYAIVTL